MEDKIVRKDHYEIVKFNGTILICPIFDGVPFVVIKCITDDLKMDYKFVSRRTKKHRRFGPRVIEWTPVQPAEGLSNKHPYVCLPIQKIAGWLYDLPSSNANPEIAELLENYQDKCDEILFDHFFGGRKNVVSFNEKALPISSEIKEKEKELKTAQDALYKTDEFINVQTLKTEVSALKERKRRLERNFLEPQLF